MGHIPLADMAYLKRRRGKGRSGYRWYVRMVVPADLQELLGKKTIEHALNTSDLKEAQRRKHAVVDEILTRFERARLHKITSADIQHEAKCYLRKRLAAIQERPGNTFEAIPDYMGREMPTYGELALLELYQLAEDEDWPVSVEREANRIAKQYGTTLTDAQQQELCVVLLRAEIQAVSRAVAAYNGEIPEPETILNPRAMDPITGEVQLPSRLSPRKGKGLRIKEAAAAYIADRNRQRGSAWTAQTLGQAETTLRLFAEFMNDAPIETITRSDVATFLAAIAELDPKYGRRIAGKQLTFVELLKAFPAQQGEGLSNKTLNRHVGIIAATFEWAIRSGKFVGDNPAKGHHRSSGGPDNEGADERRSFTIIELNKLFCGPLFTVENKQRVRPHNHTYETALMWLIPIALYTGMRLDEMCGLRVGDVSEKTGIRFFNIESYEGRRLKTSAARRKVPIHSELDLLGFKAGRPR